MVRAARSHWLSSYTLEFALLLPSHLSEVTLTKPHSTINASAVQKLASGAKVGLFSIIACVSCSHQYRANRQWHALAAHLPLSYVHDFTLPSPHATRAGHRARP